jgi:hypothetical protein
VLSLSFHSSNFGWTAGRPAKVKKAWMYTSSAPIHLYDVVLIEQRDKFTTAKV